MGTPPGRRGHNGGGFDESLANHSPGGPPRRPPFLTLDRIQLRYTTILDAFHTADRRQRGHLPYDRILEIYGLYFNAAAGVLSEQELAEFAEKFMWHTPTDGTLVVDYVKLAEALRKRDLDLMNKAAAGALRQGLMYSSPERHANLSAYPPAQHLPTEYGGAGAAMPPYRTGRGAKPPPRTEGAPYATYENGEAQQQQPAQQPPPPYANDSLTLAPAEARRRGGGWGAGGYTAVPYQQSAVPYQQSPPRAVAQGGSDAYAPTAAGPTAYASGGPTADSLSALLESLQVADAERVGRLHSAQLLTSCRLHGLTEPSPLLHALMREVVTDDGRVDYVAFVQHLATARAGQQARASLAANMPGPLS